MIDLFSIFFQSVSSLSTHSRYFASEINVFAAMSSFGLIASNLDSIDFRLIHFANLGSSKYDFFVMRVKNTIVLFRLDFKARYLTKKQGRGDGFEGSVSRLTSSASQVILRVLTYSYVTPEDNTAAKQKQYNFVTSSLFTSRVFRLRNMCFYSHKPGCKIVNAISCSN